MKPLIALCGALFLAAASVVPLPCTTFDSNTLEGWTFDHAHGGTQAGHGGHYADVHDDAQASFFVAPPAYNGDWLKLVDNCGELCFDVNILDDALATSSPVSVRFTIYDGTGKYATFTHNPTPEGSGWRTYCAPIGPGNGGVPPNNGQGTWTLGGGATWPAILQNVQKFSFSVDFAGSGFQSEHYQLDNVCFKRNTCAKADFQSGTICAGESITFPNQSTGATSSQWWTWNGNPGTSTATSPTVTYPNAGTFPVKLCINGGTAAPLCITKNVVVTPAPAMPVITGPATACQSTATYCVTNAQGGVAYSWAIQPPTAGTVTPATGTCASVHWNSTSGGTLVVTATNKAGCKVTQKFPVTECKSNNPCCPNPHFKVISATLQPAGSGYVFTPVLSSGPGTKRVVIDIISASITYSSASCGTPHTFLPAISNVHPASASGYTPSQPVLNSTEAVWTNPSGGSLSNATFPVDVTLPPHSSACSDTIHICVKYSVTDADCRTCEIIACYDFVRPAVSDPTLSPD